MFLNEEYGNISQEIGIASLGASDAIISKLAYIYLHIIEFGICLEEGEPKLYGGGLLSSVKESGEALKKKDSFQKLDCHVIDRTQHELFEPQSTYFLAESLEDAYRSIKDYT